MVANVDSDPVQVECLGRTWVRSDPQPVWRNGAVATMYGDPATLHLIVFAHGTRRGVPQRQANLYYHEEIPLELGMLQDGLVASLVSLQIEVCRRRGYLDALFPAAL